MGEKKQLREENDRLRKLVFTAAMTAVASGDRGYQQMLRSEGFGHVIGEAQSVLDDIAAEDDEGTPDDVVDAEFE